MPKYTLTWLAGRSTPVVSLKGKKRPNAAGGKVVASRSSTEEEDHKADRGEWIRARPPGQPGKESSVRSGQRKSRNRPTGDALTIADGRPTSLYVRRDVRNAQAIRNHYAQQGVQNLMPADEMHVTVIYSRQPVDWIKVGAAYQASVEVGEGGPRMHDLFGPERDVLVLQFASFELDMRHEDAKRAGASWDWPDYQPHVTLSMAPGVDVAGLRPWGGVIELGPERFEAVDDNWMERVAARTTADADKPGLWENIRRKKRRMKRGSNEHKARPGESGRPSEEALERSKTKGGG